MIETKKFDIGNVYKFGVNNPAAGAGFFIRPPEGEIWRIIGFRFLFSTSVAVASRGVVVSLYNGIELCDVFTNFIQAASLALIYTAFPGFNAVSYNGFGRCQIPWGDDILITYDNYLEVTADNIDVADQFSEIRGLVEKWKTRQ